MLKAPSFCWIMKLNYNTTLRASFVGYIVQAIVNNFAPLLFVTFNESYDIPFSKITLLITVNFFLQLCVDLASAFFVDRIGYRKSVVMAHVFAAAGLISLTILPELFADPFVGLLLSVVLYALGGGLLEVVISPIVEACPNDHKDRTMSILHSFYCWGSVAVVGISTAYFAVFGVENWKWLALIWAAVPIINSVSFVKAPLASLTGEGEKSLSVAGLLKNNTFWLFAVVILCSGAAEAAIVQWSSAFAEKGLGVSKAVGDLAGPALFSVMMGIVRLLYGKYGSGARLEKLMLLSGLLCTVSYLLMALLSSPVAAFLMMALCGASVGMMWPGTYSAASATIKGGGNAMFSFLALAGDIGCTSGPTVVGYIADAFGGDMKKGILIAVVFPIVLSVCMVIRLKTKKKE